MSNATLFFRSVLIVAIIAGIPHALAVYAGKEEASIGRFPEETTLENNSSPEEQAQDWAYYWQGKYEVSFEGLAEKAIYEIKEVDGKLKCYSIVLIDAQGNRYDDQTLLMKSIAIDEYAASANYQIKHEGEPYEVDGQMLMDEQGNVSLSYLYYGYEGKETWTRID